MSDPKRQINGDSLLRFPVGKLPMRVLERLLKRNTITDPRVLVGPRIGEDAAVIDTGAPRYLIAKTDPITFTADQIGWYAVHINANDVATMGARPSWFLATLLLPESATTESLAEKIFQDILEACRTIGVALVGGHTEITYGLSRPIVVGQMLGEVDKEKLVQTSGARAGDVIILTKGIAIEGTAIIAREREEELTAELGEATLARCKNFMFKPGLSVLKDALVAAEAAPIHAMHDPTEGGLATALHELAWSADVGLLLDSEAVPVYPETRAICNHYDLHAIGLIASGALLIVLEEAKAGKVLSKLHSEGIAATAIGQVTNKNEGVKLITRSGIHDLPIYERDELTRIPGAT
jgi:hydrogenase maturation factor